MPSTPRRLPPAEPKERSKFGRRLFAMSPSGMPSISYSLLAAVPMHLGRLRIFEGMKTGAQSPVEIRTCVKLFFNLPALGPRLYDRDGINEPNSHLWMSL